MRARSAPVVERTHKCLGQRQRQHRVTQKPEASAGRCHETGALARFFNDFAGRAHALGTVIGQQLLAAQTLDHKGQVPAQRLRILEAGVGAPHAKDREQMRCIPGKQHTAMPIVRQRQRAGGVHRTPIHFPRRPSVANHGQLGVDTGLQRAGLECIFGGFAWWQLVVHTPDTMRLSVHQDGIARVPLRVKVGQPLSWQGQVDPDVGNHKKALVRGAFHLQIHRSANL